MPIKTKEFPPPSDSSRTGSIISKASIECTLRGAVLQFRQQIPASSWAWCHSLLLKGNFLFVIIISKMGWESVWDKTHSLHLLGKKAHQEDWTANLISQPTVSTSCSKTKVCHSLQNLLSFTTNLFFFLNQVKSSQISARQESSLLSDVLFWAQNAINWVWIRTLC